MYDRLDYSWTRTKQTLGVWIAATLLCLPGLAAAAPIDVFFQGASTAAEPDTNFGIGLTFAETARDDFGIPWVTPEVIGSVDGRLGVSLPPSSTLSSDPSPPTSNLNRVESEWEVKNVSNQDLVGAVYLLFTHSDPFSINGTPIEYDDANIGITIDADLGWSIVVATDATGQDFYYPALLLDQSVSNALAGNIRSGEAVDALIRYAVAEPLIQLPGTNAYVLPELQIGFAQVVPEPGTALLFGLGLVGLASVRRKEMA